MNKLLTVIVAAMFAAVSAPAFAASHAGAPMKDDKKAATKTEAKKAAPKTTDAKKKSEPKKAAPKTTDAKKAPEKK
jgi:anaerobic C4-dicarboxylate transporter